MLLRNQPPKINIHKILWNKIKTNQENNKIFAFRFERDKNIPSPPIRLIAGSEKIVIRLENLDA